MATHKIGFDSEVSDYSDADLFSFPVNAKVVKGSMKSQREVKELPYSKFHYLIDRGGVSPRTFVLQGEFHGSNRETDFDTLSQLIYDLDSTGSGLMRFYRTSTRFFYVFGISLEELHQEKRTTFIDWVAALVCLVPFAYSDSAKFETWTISTTTATSLSSSNDNGADEGAFTNEGNAPAHILHWTITNNSGSNSITQVRIGDAAASGGDVAGNVIEWNGTLAAGGVLNIYLFKVVNKVFKHIAYDVDGTISGSRDFVASEPPFIVAGATNQSFSVKLAGTSPNVTVRADWRDAYWR